MTMLELALSYIELGWHVFPCWPKTKNPMTPRGFKDASADPVQIAEWWHRTPDANIAIATGPSRLVVVDVDHGILNWTAATEFAAKHSMYVIRTGRRPEIGLQLYFCDNGEPMKSAPWTKAEWDISGDIRSATGYVMAAGSVHPSGERYEVVSGSADKIQPPPAWVRELKKQIVDIKDDAPITENRNSSLTSIAGKLRNAGLSADALEVALLQVNADRCIPPLEDEEVRRIAANVARYELTKPDPIVRINGKVAGKPDPWANYDDVNEEPPDWRDLFHTKDDVLNCPEPTFLIEKFLQCGSICAIAAPVAQRKSLIALNAALSLCSGEPLFGFLEVQNRPSRVLYMCPEMGLISLSDRIKKIGATEYLGESFFIRSMNQTLLRLSDIPEEALEGSVLILDTAIRFLEGDENSSEDMKAFSNVLFAIQRAQGPTGAIMVLYHSPKMTKDASELTLENCLRGSGELGAAITDGHGTRLQEPEDTHGSSSYIRHIKARDYTGLHPFEVWSDPDGSGRLTAATDPREDAGAKAVLTVKKGGVKANADGQDDAAHAIIKANSERTVPELVKLLESHDITRKTTWVTNSRLAARGGGSKHKGA